MPFSWDGLGLLKSTPRKLGSLGCGFTVVYAIQSGQVVQWQLKPVVAQSTTVEFHNFLLKNSFYCNYSSQNILFFLHDRFNFKTMYYFHPSFSYYSCPPLNQNLVNENII